MRPHTAAALLALNRRFYDEFGDEFAATRRAPPPGYARILPYLASAANVLDLGCGSGRLLAFLIERGRRGRYVGLDGSERLLDEARGVALGRSGLEATFVHADLFEPDWPELARGRGPFDALVSLAVLHHIPGRANRAAFLQRCASVLPAGRPLILTTWQFLASERLRRRIVPAERFGIAQAELEPGDYFVGWGEGLPGARYCAAIDETGLIDMAAGAGLDPVEIFYSDGHEGRLSLYAIFASRAAGITAT